MKTTEDVIRAAGGIVWRIGQGAPRLAVAHRPKHQDWVLPKGKLEPGESAEAAALREVKEETGCDAVLGAFAGVIGYEVNGRPKRVEFWTMTAKGESAGALAADVDEVAWLEREEAVARLTHPLEKALLEKAAVPRGGRSRGRAYLRLLETFFDSSTARLRQSLATYGIELQRRISAAAGGETAPGSAGWAPAARELLDRAREAAERDDPETGWRCFKTATRLELFGLDAEELRLRAIRLIAEARQKLSGWRKELVFESLMAGDKLKEPLEARAVAAALELFHEYEDNLYKLLRIRRREFLTLGVLAMMLLAIFGAVVWAGGTGKPHILAVDDVLRIALLGALGAAVSGIIRVGESRSGGRIPDELSQFAVLIARLAVGASFAIALVALWGSGFLKLGAVEDRAEFVLVLAFAGGFSERLAQNAIERLTNTGGATPRAAERR